MALGIRVFLGAATLLQWAVAFHLLRQGPRGPFRIVTAALLGFNGLGSLHTALGEVPTGETLWFNLADMPTGPLFLCSGLLLLRFPRQDKWDALSITLLGATCLLIALTVGPGLLPGGYQAFVLPAFEWLHTLPAMAGLGVTALAVALALRNPDPGHARVAGLLGVAYLPVAAYYFWVEGLAVTLGGELFDAELPRTAGRLIMAAGCIAAIALLAKPGPHPAWAWSLLLVIGAMLMTYQGVTAALDGLAGASYPSRVLTTLGIYVARPLALGFAFVRRDVGWAVYESAALLTLLLAGKAIAVVVLGAPADRIAWVDLAGIGISLALLPLAWRAPRWWARRREAVRPPDRPAADERLAQFLLAEHARPAGPGLAAGAGKPAIGRATGITENNVAAAVRRLERRLDPGAPPGTFVQERILGVRGRKVYRLTDEGAARLRSLQAAGAQEAKGAGIPRPASQAPPPAPRTGPGPGGARPGPPI